VIESGTAPEHGTLGTRAAAAPAWRFVIGGMVAAAGAAAANLAWRRVYPATTGYPLPQIIDPASVALASVLSVLLAAGVYLLLSRGFTIATPLYAMGCLLSAGASCIAPFTPMLPDGTPTPPGFPLLTIPMHLMAGVMAAIVVPLVVLLGVKKSAR
jgi:hypothetical protein